MGATGRTPSAALAEEKSSLDDAVGQSVVPLSQRSFWVEPIGPRHSIPRTSRVVRLSRRPASTDERAQR